MSEITAVVIPISVSVGLSYVPKLLLSQRTSTIPSYGKIIEFVFVEGLVQSEISWIQQVLMENLVHDLLTPGNRGLQTQTLSGIQHTSCLLWKTIHYHIHRPCHCSLSRSTWISCTLLQWIFRPHLISFWYLPLRLPSVFLTSDIMTKYLCLPQVLQISPTHCL